MQPIVVVIGPDEKHLVKFICCFNEIRWKVNDLLTALDIIFKFFFTTQVDYPFESQVQWSIVQCFIYNIQDPQCSKAAPVLTDLKSIPELPENDPLGKNVLIDMRRTFIKKNKIVLY